MPLVHCILFTPIPSFNLDKCFVYPLNDKVQTKVKMLQLHGPTTLPPWRMKMVVSNEYQRAFIKAKMEASIEKKIVVNLIISKQL
jgi:hypothetical protein